MLARGEKAPLEHSTEASERILVGLRWDERYDKVQMLDRVIKKDSQHDLDLVCYIYGPTGEFIDFVGAEAQDSMDETGKIYHSGDDMTGAGEGDDEFINAELGKLPNSVHSLVFMAEIRSNHGFDDVASTYCRLADGMTDKNLMEVYLDHGEAKGKHAFVMCAVTRSEASPTGWQLYNISEYPDTSSIDNWGGYLSQFVD